MHRFVSPACSCLVVVVFLFCCDCHCELFFLYYGKNLLIKRCNKQVKYVFLCEALTPWALSHWVWDSRYDDRHSFMSRLPADAFCSRPFRGGNKPSQSTFRKHSFSESHWDWIRYLVQKQQLPVQAEVRSTVWNTMQWCYTVCVCGVGSLCY